VSAPAGQTQPAPQPPVTAPAAEACPLCGAPLAQEQEWCLRCGAAARTRLAAAPSWKAPLIALAIVAALALGVLAAALVKLAGDSGPAPAPVTRTVTTAAATPGVATTATTTVSPAAGTPGATAPTTLPTTAVTAPTAPSPGVQTTPRTPSPAGGSTTNTKAGKGRLRGLKAK
jgi:hypothetical protein